MLRNKANSPSPPAFPVTLCFLRTPMSIGDDGVTGEAPGEVAELPKVCSLPIAGRRRNFLVDFVDLVKLRLVG
jgi:hypothetical protein